MKVIENLNNRIGPHAQAMLDNKKLELKEYTNKAVRYRDGKSSSKRSFQSNLHTKDYMYQTAVSGT